MGVLRIFSIKNFFCDKMDLRLFYFHVIIFVLLLFFYCLESQKITSKWIQKDRECS